MQEQQNTDDVIKDLLARIGLIPPREWTDTVEWWDGDKCLGKLPSDPYNRYLWLLKGYRPVFDYMEMLHQKANNPWMKGELPVPEPRPEDLGNHRATLNPTDDKEVLVEKIRADLREHGELEIRGTATEIAKLLGFQGIHPTVFSKMLNQIQDRLEVFGIDIQKKHNHGQRLIRIFDNPNSPYHPKQQGFGFEND